MSDSVWPHRWQPTRLPRPGILQARTLEWVAISFNAWKWKVKVKLLNRVRPSAIPSTAAHQAPPSMGFSRQEYWSGVPLPSPYENLSIPYFLSQSPWFLMAILFRVKACSVTSVMSHSLWSCGLSPARLFCSWDPPGKNAEVGCHILLQGNLSYPGIELGSARVSCIAGRFFTYRITCFILLAWCFLN